MPEATATTTRARLVQLVVVAAVAVQVLPILLTTRFPDQDGPAHLASSVAISGAYHGAAADGLHRYVTIHLDLGRSPLGHLLVAALVRTAGVLDGQRLFLVAYLVLFALAGWYALTAVRRRSGPLLTMLLPVGSGSFLLLGFWDFLLSLVGALVVVGYWLRHHDDDGPRKYVVVSVLLLGGALLHPSGLIVGVPFVGVIALFDALRIRDRAAARGIVAAALACVPALVPAAMVAANASGSTPRPPLEHSVRGLFGLASVVRVLNSRAEAALTLGLVALLGVLFVAAAVERLRIRRVVVVDAALFLAVACAVGSLAAPGATGGAEILNERLAVFAVVLLIVWLAAQEFAPRLLTGAVVLGAVVAIGLVAIRIPVYRRLDRNLREIASVDGSMVPGRTFVLVLGRDTTEVDRLTSEVRVEPFRSAGGYFAAQRKLVGLDNYEGRFRYFPYQYVAARDPVRQLFLLDDPRVFNRIAPLDIAGYTRRTGGVVDYVVVLGPTDRALAAQLAARVPRDHGEQADRPRHGLRPRPVTGPGYAISPNASAYEMAVIDMPSSICSSRRIWRTSSTGTHSTRSDSPGSVGSPTWVAPSATNVWKTWSLTPLIG